MKKLSLTLLAETVRTRRKAKHLTQAQLSEITGINRSMLGRLENETYKPSLDQLEALAQVLEFEIPELYREEIKPKAVPARRYNVAVAGTGYVGLSIATLLAQHNHVTAVDILAEKVALINRRKSPIQDACIEKYLMEKELDLTATLDGESAYRDADFVVIAAPTNYDSKKNYFDTSAVEAVIELNVSPKKSRGFDEIAATIAAFDEVESVLLMSGGYDLQLVIKGQTFQEIALFVAKRLSPLDDVLSTATHFVLRTYKKEGRLYQDDEIDERECTVL